AEGRDIIGLTIGEPDFPTPDNVKRAVAEAMARDDTRYTTVDGTDEMKDAARLKFKRENGLVYAREQITVANGAKQIVFNAMMATLSTGDEVLIPAPYWVSYLDMALVADGTPVAITCSEDNGFKLTPAQLAVAITPRTKWLVLNSPGNPTGATYSRAELAALAEVLLRHPHVWILTDDIYEHLLFDGREFCTIAQVEPRLYDRTLTVNGVSKAYSMTGWRIGYAGGPKELMRNMAKLQSQSTSNPCSISQAAAVEALTGPQEYVHLRAREFEERRNVVVPLLNAAPGLRCRMPEGAFYAFPSCAGVLGRKTPAGKLLETEQDFALYLLDNGVAGIQGEAYGLSPYLRFSIATDLATLQEACARIQRACAALT
ncbi:MAG TPA: aminotransferase class I/II-fold pyridoxal phosphate-dependent enzyme, partial [Rhodanobacteraceae bacterium]|nr:aminotransferase class I/II-fold pyridoxal phosphate-dependent enzyme [Rhodanobacteraceae bacterium]